MSESTNQQIQSDWIETVVDAIRELRGEIQDLKTQISIIKSTVNEIIDNTGLGGHEALWVSHI